MKVITLFIAENEEEYTSLNKNDDLYYIARRQLDPKGPDCVDIFVFKDNVDNMINVLNPSVEE